MSLLIVVFSFIKHFISGHTLFSMLVIAAAYILDIDQEITRRIVPDHLVAAIPEITMRMIVFSGIFLGIIIPFGSIRKRGPKHGLKTGLYSLLGALASPLLCCILIFVASPYILLSLITNTGADIGTVIELSAGIAVVLPVMLIIGILTGIVFGLLSIGPVTICTALGALSGVLLINQHYLYWGVLIGAAWGATIGFFIRRLLNDRYEKQQERRLLGY